MIYGEQVKITRDLAKRLIELQGIRAAVPVTPLPGEGLADLIFRAASLNGYRSCRDLLRRPMKNPFSHKSSTTRIPDLPLLADILGIPGGAGDIAGLANYREPSNQIASQMSCKTGRQPRNFFGAVLPIQQFVGHRRVAPQSLRASNHSKAVWHLRTLCFDPKSHEMLLDRCPGCGHQLDFRYPCGVSRCGFCGPNIDLRDHPQRILEVEDESALRFVTALIDPEGVFPRQIHTDLECLDRGEVFLLCAMIGATLDGRLTRSGSRKIISGAVEATPESLSKAGRAILSWPQGIIDLHSQLESSSIFDQYIYGRHRFSELIRRAKMFSVTTTSVLRRVVKSPETLSSDGKELSGAELWKAHSGAIEPDRGALWRMFGHSWQSRKVREISERIGIPRRVLFDCFLRGIIPFPHRDVATSVDAAVRGIKEMDDSVLHLPAQGVSCLSVQRTVSALYSGIGNPWPAVLDVLRQGKLPVVRSFKSLNWLNGLFVEDFGIWNEFCQNLEPVLTSMDLSLHYEDIGFHLAVSGVTAEIQLSKIKNQYQVKTLRDLSHFRAAYVSIREIESWLVMGNRPRQQVTPLLEGTRAKRGDDLSWFMLREDFNEFLHI